MKTASACYTAVSLALSLVAIGCAHSTGEGMWGGGAADGEEGGGGVGGAASGATRPEDPPRDEGLFDGWGAPDGRQGGAGGSGCGYPPFAGVIRDFKAFEGGQGHPDFQVFTGEGLKGIVEDGLDEEHKPVYAPAGPTEMTAGKDAFDQWFRDVDGVNIAIPLTLTPEVDEDGLATYQDIAFFPIDDQGWGNELFWHNFHFTFELHMSFVYRGGEVFSFAGDDDLWVFVNGRLAIDLGGVHEAQAATLDLDAGAGELGLVVGEEYPLDFFQAERHTTESKFKIQTTLEFTNCEPIVY